MKKRMCAGAVGDGREKRDAGNERRKKTLEGGLCSADEFPS